ncbi:hypothetical protein N7510_006752 [Penicillium lagena]|uniref:uncharacterized protein n=1 Tax=Penicillium lagena TaxID=94218 RepID=UPI00253FC77D|nr:uncharacterized protein N7510_006752 [Penicillium lagena]KAJ5610033.1 hypothetical protein N7510_006752 [Penicillium lagena]
MLNPKKILQIIASLLPTDKDVTNFSLVCRDISDTVLPSESTIWRSRFGDLYDIPPGRSSKELKTEYKVRAIVLAQNIDFKQGEGPQQCLWLEVVHTMLLESLTLPLKNYTSKTYDHLSERLKKLSFLRRPVSGYGLYKPQEPSELFCAVQLVMYACGDEVKIPLIQPDAPNLTNLLHMRNFWQRHLRNHCECTFFETFAKLPDHLRPSARVFSDEEFSLGTSWLGYYCKSGFSDSLELELQPDDEMTWPPEFDAILPRLGQSKNRAYFRGVQQTYGGTTPARNGVIGFTEPIAVHYGGFPGWTRICFAIRDEGGQPAQAGSSAEQGQWKPWALERSAWLHGYEAVILPGGAVMLGRWVDMKDMTGRGPFIFWDV